jgi:uncharacterized protein YceK
MRCLLIILVAAITLAGCASVERSAKTVTDKICSLSEAEKTVLAERFDDITDPHKIRVVCN